METRPTTQAGKLFVQKKYPEAFLLYDTMIRSGVKTTSTLANRGICFAKLKQWDEALKDLNEALTLPAPQDYYDTTRQNIAALQIDRICHALTLSEEEKYYVPALEAITQSNTFRTESTHLQFMLLLTDQSLPSAPRDSMQPSRESKSSPSPSELKTKTKTELLQYIIKDRSPTDKLFYQALIDFSNNKILEAYEKLMALLNNTLFWKQQLDKKTAERDPFISTLLLGAFFKLLTDPKLFLKKPWVTDKSDYSKESQSKFIQALERTDDPLRHRLMLYSLSRNTPSGALLYTAQDDENPASITAGSLNVIVKMLIKEKDKLILDPQIMALLSTDLNLCKDLHAHFPVLYQVLFRKAPAAEFKFEFLSSSTRYDPRLPPAQFSINNTGEGNGAIGEDMLEVQVRAKFK